MNNDGGRHEQVFLEGKWPFRIYFEWWRARLCVGQRIKQWKC